MMKLSGDTDPHVVDDERGADILRIIQADILQR